MATEMTGTVEGGILKLDGVLPFPEKTRLKLIIEPVWDSTRALNAWSRLKAMASEKPLFGPGVRFSRDELYERD